MAFQEAVSYALCCVHRGDLVLKREQEEVLSCLYRGQDVFAWLPTGYGKSLCFQLLPFMYDFKLGRTTSPLSERSVVIVVSPLVSLMVDQVANLRLRSVPAGILSGNKDVDKSLVVSASDVSVGRCQLLYSAPEALLVDQWKHLILSPPLSNSIVAIAVDEAHCVFKWSRDFRPAFDHIRDLRAFVPCGIPVLAATATVTESMRTDIIEKLDMVECCVVSVCPNKKNIFYEVVSMCNIEDDFAPVVKDLAENNIRAERVLVYCRSLDMCSCLYAHFLYTLGEKSYYPSGAEHLSDNRLFGMYHSCTDEHNKQVIVHSFSQPDGVVRVVFATMALGMGVDFRNIYHVVHYGAPRSLDDYLQESGRVGRDGQQAFSKICWRPAEAPIKKNQGIYRNREVAAVRRYLENSGTCRRYVLLSYFDKTLADNLERCDKMMCCDICCSLVSRS